MKKFIIIVLTIIIIVLSCCGCTAKGHRTVKSIQSNWNGGLDRTIVVYSMTGEEIARYSGKIDIEENESKVLFDLDGKRYIYYNCLVEVIEN